jgi:hypothetical protein
MKRLVYFMNPGLRIFAGWKGAFAILLLCTTVASPNAQPQSTNAKSSATATNGSLKDAVVPKSVFLMPKDKEQGVDPFFPKSRYPYVGPVVPIIVPTNVPEPVRVEVDLKLKAISGLPEHRLALINNHTFEAGEEGEIITNKGRMRIRCLEVRQDSAIVQVGNEHRELRLPNF